MPDKHQDQGLVEHRVEAGQIIAATLVHRLELPEEGIPDHDKPDRLLFRLRLFLGRFQIRQPEGPVQSQNHGPVLPGDVKSLFIRVVIVFLRDVVGQVAEKNFCPGNAVRRGIRKKDAVRQLLYVGDILIFLSVQGR